MRTLALVLALLVLGGCGPPISDHLVVAPADGRVELHIRDGRWLVHTPGGQTEVTSGLTVRVRRFPAALVVVNDGPEPHQVMFPHLRDIQEQDLAAGQSHTFVLEREFSGTFHSHYAPHLPALLLKVERQPG